MAEVSLSFLQSLACLNLLFIARLLEAYLLLAIFVVLSPFLFTGDLAPTPILVRLLPLKNGIVFLIDLLENVAETNRIR